MILTAPEGSIKLTCCIVTDHLLTAGDTIRLGCPSMTLKDQKTCTRKTNVPFQGEQDLLYVCLKKKMIKTYYIASQIDTMSAQHISLVASGTHFYWQVKLCTFKGNMTWGSASKCDRRCIGCLREGRLVDSLSAKIHNRSDIPDHQTEHISHR